jgi:hypothetical protein
MKGKIHSSLYILKEFLCTEVGTFMNLKALEENISDSTFEIGTRYALYFHILIYHIEDHK